MSLMSRRSQRGDAPGPDQKRSRNSRPVRFSWSGTMSFMLSFLPFHRSKGNGRSEALLGRNKPSFPNAGQSETFNETRIGDPDRKSGQTRTFGEIRSP